MTSARSSILGAGIGATSMFLLDPVRGARRRALIRDKVAFARRKTADATGATWRDFNNRMAGLQARARSLFSEVAIDDATLKERVKAALGRVTAHQRAISVDVADGCVRLGGDALASEAGSIVSAVNRVRGVLSVQSNLRTHASAQHIPMLQGGSFRPGRWMSWIHGSWSPTALVAAGAAIAIGAVTMARGSGDVISAAGVTE
jgi:BON domain